MYIATIDCGTTNSRVYVVNEEAEVLGKASKKVGVKDTASTGSTETLKTGLKEAYYAAVEGAGLESKDIAFIISSGMITSELGLKELPHLWAPAGMQELADNITKVHDTSVFPIDKPVYFVRGIKNRYDLFTKYFPVNRSFRDGAYLIRRASIFAISRLAKSSVKNHSW